MSSLIGAAPGNASFELRLPLFGVVPGAQPNPSNPGLVLGTFGASASPSAALGDLTGVFKCALYTDRAGNVLSIGTAVVAPTGASTIGGVQPLFNVDGVAHARTIQPFLGFFRAFGSLREG